MPISSPRTELRKDPASGRWVLVRHEAPRWNGNGLCPFCPGHEEQTPKEIAAYRTNGQSPDSPEWLLRVIPERAPILQIEGNIYREGFGIFDMVSGRGASEILIEAPDHENRWEVRTTESVERILRMYRDRIEDLYRDPQIRAVLILRRERSDATQILHPFSRILGIPIIFEDLRRELVAARHHFALKQRCLYCDIIRQESREGSRIVFQSSRFLTFTPYGSGRPFETWVLPIAHSAHFESLSEADITDLARSLREVSRRLHGTVPGAPLELCLHTAPNPGMRLREDEWETLPEDYHWHIEIAPGGVHPETVGGFYVNSVAPEIAARTLRDQE